jgi:hypothetical protein
MAARRIGIDGVAVDRCAEHEILRGAAIGAGWLDGLGLSCFRGAAASRQHPTDQRGRQSAGESL